MERIAQGTEEDYQSLIELLHSFDVETVRTTVSNDWEDYYNPYSGKIDSPPMNPRDSTAMIGDKFFMPKPKTVYSWEDIREDHWPITPHVLNFRHRYFWDGGLHCITSDLHREGDQQDYFPNRG